MPLPRVRHSFGEPGVWLTWEDSGLLFEARQVPLESVTVTWDRRQRAARGRPVPTGGLGSAHRDKPSEGEIWKALHALRDEFERAAPEGRVALTLAGFTSSNFFAPRRPRGQPPTPGLLLAAVAALWEERQSREEVAKRVNYGTDWVKTRVRGARDRGFLDESNTTTVAARLLLANDGREPEDIVAAWTQRTLEAETPEPSRPSDATRRWLRRDVDGLLPMRLVPVAPIELHSEAIRWRRQGERYLVGDPPVMKEFILVPFCEVPR